VYRSASHPSPPAHDIAIAVVIALTALVTVLMGQLETASDAVEFGMPFHILEPLVRPPRIEDGIVSECRQKQSDRGENGRVTIACYLQRNNTSSDLLALRRPELYYCACALEIQEFRHSATSVRRPAGTLRDDSVIFME